MALVSPKACGCTCGCECPVAHDGTAVLKAGVAYCEDCVGCIQNEVAVPISRDQAHAMFATWQLAASFLDHQPTPEETQQLNLAAGALLELAKDVLPWDDVEALDEYLDGYFTDEEFARRKAAAGA